jgi:colicin import membrane protein
MYTMKDHYNKPGIKEASGNDVAQAVAKSKAQVEQKAKQEAAAKAEATAKAKAQAEAKAKADAQAKAKAQAEQKAKQEAVTKQPATPVAAKPDRAQGKPSFWMSPSDPEGLALPGKQLQEAEANAVLSGVQVIMGAFGCQNPTPQTTPQIQSTEKKRHSVI